MTDKAAPKRDGAPAPSSSVSPEKSPRRAMPGSSSKDKHPPIRRGESFTTKGTLGTWRAC